MKVNSFIIILLFLYVGNPLLCQQFYRNGKIVPNPFVGGLRNPHFSFFDLNRDGFEDIIIYDTSSGLINSYLNDGLEEQISFTYNENFHVDGAFIHRWLKIIDINEDGLPDIISTCEDNETHMCIYLGMSYSDIHIDCKNEPLTITYINDKDTLPIKNNILSTPTFYDVDVDNKQDALLMNESETHISFYKQVSITDQVATFSLTTGCFGQVYVDRNDIILSDDSLQCAQNKTGTGIWVHGGSSLTLWDANCDNKPEILIGDGIKSSLTALSNFPKDTIHWFVDKKSPFPIQAAELSRWVHSWFSDVNNDGLKDLILSQNDNLNGQSYNHIHLYINIGNECHPDFELYSQNFLAEDMIYHDAALHPSLVDYDQDGDQDIIIGLHIIDSIGQYISQINGYINNGNETYTYIEDPFDINRYLGVLYGRPSPTFGDVDNDGDEDMLIGEINGVLHFFENIGSPTDRITFAPPIYNYFELQVGINSVPVIYDIDHDDRPDLLVSRYKHGIQYYKNIGTPSMAVFNQQDPNNVGNIGQIFKDFTDPNYLNGSISLSKIDGKSLLSIGYRHNNVHIYDITNVNLLDDWPLILEVNIKNKPKNSNPILQKSMPNNRIDLLYGTEAGGFKIEKNILNSSNLSKDYIPDIPLSFYPNPVKDFIYFDHILIETISIYDILGKFIDTLKPTYTTLQHTVFDLKNLNSGLYYLKVNFSGMTKTIKVIKASK